MISLEHITDPTMIKCLVFKDTIYKTMIRCKDFTTWMPDTIGASWYLVSTDSKQIGIIVLKQLSDNCICFHGGMYKRYRGPQTVFYLQDCLKLIKERTGCVLITTQHENSKLARRLVQHIGFKLKTTINNGYRDGKLLLFGEE